MGATRRSGPCRGLRTHFHRGASEGDTGEWVVPVRWWVAQPAEDAFWVKGVFANQNSACKLRQEFTLDRLAQHFNIDEGEAG